MVDRNCGSLYMCLAFFLGSVLPSLCAETVLENLGMWCGTPKLGFLVIVMAEGDQTFGVSLVCAIKCFVDFVSSM
jgi:predicted small integral membrane protein